MLAEFGGDGANLSGRSLRVVRADPPNACGALTDASGKYKDAIVLARRGQCFFVEKMAAASAAGAAAVVIINDRWVGMCFCVCCRMRVSISCLYDACLLLLLVLMSRGSGMSLTLFAVCSCLQGHGLLQDGLTDAGRC